MTQTAGTPSVARGTRGVGTNSLLVNETATGSVHEVNCEMLTRDNVDKLSGSGTNEQLFEDDISSQKSGFNGIKSGIRL